MEKKELKKGIKVWCWWKSRTLRYTGYEGNETGYNTLTKDYTPRHYYRFVDEIGAITIIYDEDLAKLEIR